MTYFPHRLKKQQHLPGTKIFAKHVTSSIRTLDFLCDTKPSLSKIYIRRSCSSTAYPNCWSYSHVLVLRQWLSLLVYDVWRRLEITANPYHRRRKFKKHPERLSNYELFWLEFYRKGVLCVHVCSTFVLVILSKFVRESGELKHPFFSNLLLYIQFHFSIEW